MVVEGLGQKVPHATPRRSALTHLLTLLAYSLMCSRAHLEQPAALDRPNPNPNPNPDPNPNPNPNLEPEPTPTPTPDQVSKSELALEMLETYDDYELVPHRQIYGDIGRDRER